MTKHSINIQDGYLFQNLKESTVLEVHLMTGKSFTGRIRRFDRFAVVLEPLDGGEVLVYKHAIATIAEA